MPTLRKIFCIILFLNTIVPSTFSQNISIDLTKTIYLKQLDYSCKNIIKIERKYFNFDNQTTIPIRIVNTANFENINFQCKSDLSNLTFNENSIFSDANFDSLTTFYNSFFNSEAYFDASNFHSSASFNTTHFLSNTFISDVYFYNIADFGRAQFDSFTNFFESSFDSLANFSDDNFNSDVYFDNVDFNSLALFTDAHFDSITSFKEARFFSLANFDAASFYSVTDFSYAFFTKKIIFSHVKTNSNTRFDFNHARLPDSIDFSYNPNLLLQLPVVIDLTLCDFPEDSMKNAINRNSAKKIEHFMREYFHPNNIVGKHKIDLYNTDISKVKIDYTHFSLYFEDNDDPYRKDLQPDKKASIYEQLLKTFKDRGQTESYEKLDIEYQWFKGRNNPLLTSFIDWWWRFGYEKWRIFIHAILFIILFSLVNFFAIDILNDKNSGLYHIDRVPEFLAFKHSKNTIGRLLRRLWFSIVYTSIIFFQLTLKVEKIKFSKPGSLWIIFIYTTGLICMGFMANLILQK